MEQTIKVDDFTIYCKTFGEPYFDKNESCIILLHDALGSVAQWKNFPILISEKLKIPVIAFDRINYGKSDFKGELRTENYLEKAAKNEVHLSIEKVYRNKNIILIGHSDGGSIALVYASLFPKNVKAIIALAPHVLVEELTIVGIRKTEGELQSSQLAQRLEKYHGVKNEYLISGWTKTWSLMYSKNWNLYDYLKRISCPILLIQGHLDEYGSIFQLNQIKKLVTSEVKIAMIDDCRHFPHKEKTEEVINLIFDFYHNAIAKF